MAISGNATTAEGLPADFVRIFSWPTSELVGVAVPDESGDWSHEVPQDGEYGLTYIAAGCQPITHGPYYIEGPRDPHWYKVVSLLHFDGDLTDQTGRIWTVTGTGVTVEDTMGVFGGRLRSEGVLGNHVRTSLSEDFTFGVDDFTLEFWLNYRRQTEGPCGILDFRTISSVWQQPRPAIYTNGSGSLVYVTEGIDKVSVLPPVGWTHIAVCRHNGVGRMFLGGGLVGEWPDTTDYLPGPCTLAHPGDSKTSDRVLIGDLDELRITKGVARYTEDFDPPTGPFPNQGPA